VKIAVQGWIYGCQNDYESREGMSNIEIKQATTADIPVIENILLDTVNWLNEMNQPLWRADFYIAFADGTLCGRSCYNA
jgi:hypothetical protein